MHIEFYRMADGTEPVADFIRSLDELMYAKTMHMIDLLEAHGYLLRPPYSKNLGNGIMELRISAGGNISRILYFFVVGNTAVLTNGFIKKTQKTPSAEIERAERYRKDYMRRNFK